LRSSADWLAPCRDHARTDATPGEKPAVCLSRIGADGLTDTRAVEGEIARHALPDFTVLNLFLYATALGRIAGAAARSVDAAIVSRISLLADLVVIAAAGAALRRADTLAGRVVALLAPLATGAAAAATAVGAALLIGAVRHADALLSLASLARTTARAARAARAADLVRVSRLADLVSIAAAVRAALRGADAEPGRVARFALRAIAADALVVATAVGAALPPGTVGGTAEPFQVALIVRWLTAAVPRTTPGPRRTARRPVARADLGGTDLAEAVAAAAVAVLLTGLASRGAGSGIAAPTTASTATIVVVIVVVLVLVLFVLMLVVVGVALLAVALLGTPMHPLVGVLGCARHLRSPGR
jgi:hypothetical protein